MDPTNPHRLTRKQFAFVAAYLGPCKGNATRAALEAGYSPKTAAFIGAENLNKPKIQAAIAEWRSEIRGFAVREATSRIADLDEIKNRLWRVIAARAEEHRDFAAGGDTGLLVKTTKMLGSGKMAVEVDEYTYDSAIVRDLASIYAQIAKEVGADKVTLEISGPDGGPVVTEHRDLIDFSSLPDELLDSMTALFRERLA